MNRRLFLAATAALAAPPLSLPAFAQGAPKRTRWVLRGSEGFDAITFLGPLSGDPFYARHYAKEIAGFAPRLPAGMVDRIRTVKDAAKARDIMMTPTLALILSSGHDASIAALIAAIDAPEQLVRPAYAASANWNANSWGWFMEVRGDIRAMLAALAAAGFAEFRQQVFGATLAKRLAELQPVLDKYDVVAEQERMTGRTIDPRIEAILLHFCRPHGIKVQGAQFLSPADIPNDTWVFSAIHEGLHPPIKMDGPLAKRLIAAADANPVLRRALVEHDRSFGYTTMEGVVNEDLTAALDQMIGERLGVAKPPARRWTTVDGGFHILAAGLYGLLMRDGYPSRGGNIEQWLDGALGKGWLTPTSLNAAASAVLGRPVDRLWPVPPGTML